MNEKQITEILNLANKNLQAQEGYEGWMEFDGASVNSNGQIIPTFKSTNGHTGLDCPKFPIYQEVWKSLVLELNL